MGFKDLPDVHTGRHAKRVQNDVNRSSVFGIRHILQREHAGNRTFVTVASGNLIAGLNFTLGRNEDLNHLQNARQQIIAALNFFNLVFKVFLNFFQTGVKSIQEFFNLGHNIFVFDDNLTPLGRRNSRQNIFGNRHILGNAFRRVNHNLANQH